MGDYTKKENVGIIKETDVPKQGQPILERLCMKMAVGAKTQMLRWAAQPAVGPGHRQAAQSAQRQEKW